MPIRKPWLVLVLFTACGEGADTAGDAVVTTQAPASTAPASVLGAIVATNVSWGDLFARGRADQMAGFYTDDAVLMTPQGDLTGTAVIGDHFRALFATRSDTILATSTVTEVLDVAGDRAYETGTLTRTIRDRTDSTAPTRELRVRYATFWERSSDGRWRIRRSLRAP